MDPMYQQLIDRELARIDALRRRIAHHEAKVATLRQLADDDVDEFSEQEKQPVAVEASAPAEGQSDESYHQQPLAIEFRDPRRMISKSNLALLRFIGSSGKSLDELEQYAEMFEENMDRGALRSFANVYRTRFGFLQSPANSFYRLTERGERYLSEQDAKPADDGAVDRPSDGDRDE